MALAADRSHVAVSTRSEVRSHDADGRLLQRTEYFQLERPFTPDEWERRRRNAEARTGAAGSIWLRGGLESPRWLVLAPDGTARSVAEVGHGYHILDIGQDHVLVRRRNPLHIPIVKVLPILRVARPGPNGPTRCP